MNSVMNCVMIVFLFCAIATFSTIRCSCTIAVNIHTLFLIGTKLYTHVMLHIKLNSKF